MPKVRRQHGPPDGTTGTSGAIESGCVGQIEGCSDQPESLEYTIQ